jgi:hypothetical protein
MTVAYGFVCPTKARRTQNGKATIGRGRCRESKIRPWPGVPGKSDRRLQSQGLRSGLGFDQVRRITSVESSLMIEGHRFQRTITVPRFGQTSGVQQGSPSDQEPAIGPRGQVRGSAGIHQQRHSAQVYTLRLLFAAGINRDS